MVKLSVVILSYNTREITKKCLTVLLDKLPSNRSFATEIIVVDNGSKDGSCEMIKLQITNYKLRNRSLKLIENEKNLGYPKGNNQGLAAAKGEYILFLNSDVLIQQMDFENLISYLQQHKEIGVLTVKVILSNGEIDPASHRGFPTLWNSFCYFFKLESIFKRIPFLNKLFGGYHLVDKNLKIIHEIDSPTGAFYLTRRKILDQTTGFDEDYFMYGEDLDLSFKIKQLGFTIVYYPFYEVLHLKRLSGLKKNDLETRKTTKQHFYSAMEIFYTKHYKKKYPSLLNRFVYFCIHFLKTW